MIFTIKRYKGTFLILHANKRTLEAKETMIQFSFVKPWLIPHRDLHFSCLDIPIYGWLFFYFGSRVTGILTKDNKVFRIYDRHTCDMVHALIKNKDDFTVTRVPNSKEVKIKLKNVKYEK